MREKKKRKRNGKGDFSFNRGSGTIVGSGLRVNTLHFYLSHIKYSTRKTVTAWIYTLDLTYQTFRLRRRRACNTTRILLSRSRKALYTAPVLSAVRATRITRSSTQHTCTHVNANNAYTEILRPSRFLSENLPISRLTAQRVFRVVREFDFWLHWPFQPSPATWTFLESGKSKGRNSSLTLATKI